MQPVVLVVEDEEDIAELLRFALTRVGFSVVWMKNLSDARHHVNKILPDVVVLDWMLPDGEGVLWMRQLRDNQRTRHLPIIMLTARAQEADKLKGLEGGADDYVTKPFSPKELVARINNVLRRAAPQHVAQVFEFAGCTLNDDDHTLTKGSVVETLGKTEFKLLKFLLTHHNKTFSRTQLLDLVWGDHVYIEERTVDVHVLRLRKILQRFGAESYLETIRGVGYRWRAV
ncbi:response regulator [Hydromonas duriensis]|uniref:response regulator n=1 Tax=Hydromonas duriensis TaxID=1527608 RepID=UPI001060F08B|nr:response regulator [Hydromonas duriensis]